VKWRPEEPGDPNEPDWPTEQACPCCGKPCWAVEAEDGSEVLLDVRPMDTELATELFGVVRRVRAVTSYVHPDAYAVSGWKLLDPVRVKGGEDEGWYWYASRVRLTVEDDQPLYSEHVYVCQRVSPKVVEGLLSVVSFNGGAAADIYGSRVKKVALREQREAAEAWMRAGNKAALPSEIGVQGSEAATQLSLFH
jgi:hypothetical protein